jgi:putative peptidoglycan lipid II flippase
LVKGFRQIAVLTTASRVLGMVRDMAYAHFWGRAPLADLWVIAFMVPNLSRRIFGEGALSSSFIPIYLEELHKEPQRAGRLADTVTSVLVALLSGLVLVGELGIWLYMAIWPVEADTRLMLVLTAIMLPYTVMICATAVLGGILNAHRHFAAPAVAPIVLNVVIVATLVLTAAGLRWPLDHQAYTVAAAVLLAGVIQLAIQGLPLRRHGVHLRPSWDIRMEPFRRIVILMVPMVVGLTVTQINTLANNAMAWILSGPADSGGLLTLWGHAVGHPLRRGAVSGLYYAQRLYQFPLGVVGISLATAIYPVLSADAARGDMSALSKTISRGLQSSLFVAIPATAGFFLVGSPLISALFQHGRFTGEDTAAVFVILVCYALGLCGYFMQQILTRAFYSMQDSTTPLWSSLAAVGVNVILGLALVWPMGAAGLAAATALCAYVQVIVLARSIHRRLGSSVLEGVMETLLKSIVATGLMVAVSLIVLAGLKGLPSDRKFSVLRVAAVVPAAACVYLMAAKVLRLEALSLILGKTGKPDVR